MATGGGGAGSTSSRMVEAGSPSPHLRNKWASCFGGFSCLKTQKGGNRIVPASRIPDGNAYPNNGNRPQPIGNSGPNTSLVPSLLAPPSSPASFTNSALPSTVQSPSCFSSIAANSPGGPSSTMFATGPYAHETQLVTPPAFSAYTTEPSTAPLTPPPELAHPTTPSSPDVPFARFLSSSMNRKNSCKANGMAVMHSKFASADLQTTYALYPGSPSSSFISPASATPRTGLSSPFPEQECSNNWGNFTRDPTCYSNGSLKCFEVDSTQSRNFTIYPETSFFCPVVSAQIYLDLNQQPFLSNLGGKESVSRDMEIYSAENRHSKACKQDMEDNEAYRASFGFSADEIIPSQYNTQISDDPDDSFTIAPFICSNSRFGHFPVANTGKTTVEEKIDRGKAYTAPASPKFPEVRVDSGELDHGYSGTTKNSPEAKACTAPACPKFPEGQVDYGEVDHGSNGWDPEKHGNKGVAADGLDEAFAKISPVQVSRSRFCSQQSSSDAEIDYRRARSRRDAAKFMLTCPN